MYPRARRHGLLVDQVGDETVVFDEARRETHLLTQIAANGDTMPSDPGPD